jgi:hypothetical protein
MRPRWTWVVVSLACVVGCGESDVTKAQPNPTTTSTVTSLVVVPLTTPPLTPANEQNAVADDMNLEPLPETETVTVESAPPLSTPPSIGTTPALPQCPGDLVEQWRERVLPTLMEASSRRVQLFKVALSLTPNSEELQRNRVSDAIADAQEVADPDWQSACRFSGYRSLSTCVATIAKLLPGKELSRALRDSSLREQRALAQPDDSSFAWLGKVQELEAAADSILWAIPVQSWPCPSIVLR